ncbi:Zn-ribbon domain-containing OB-fold protein, partial [Chloroflexota bacterium]
YPPAMICPHCLNLESEWVKLSGKGRVHSFIVVRRAFNPTFADEIPYTVAVIETEEGTRMVSNVIGCKPEDVRVDMPVEVVFEDVTEEFTLHKFKPAA